MYPMFYNTLTIEESFSRPAKEEIHLKLIAYEEGFVKQSISHK